MIKETVVCAEKCVDQVEIPPETVRHIVDIFKAQRDKSGDKLTFPPNAQRKDTDVV